MPKKVILKTVRTKESPRKMLSAYPNPAWAKDYLTVLKLFEEATGEKGVMWGRQVGFGSYTYTRSNGAEGEWYRVGFAPSSSGLTIYSVAGYKIPSIASLLKKLGKHKVIGLSCMQVRSLGDIDLSVLMQLVRESTKEMKKKYG